MENKKSLWKALVFSLLICLAGSVVWGLVYSAGYMVYLVAAGTAVLAGTIFLKFYKFNFVSFIWIVGFAILFNEIATLIALNLEVINDIVPGLSFSQGMELLVELIKINEEVNSAFVSDTLCNVLFVILGGFIVWINIIVQNKRAKAVNPINSNDNKANQPSVNAPKKEKHNEEFTLFYIDTKIKFKAVVEEFKKTKDREAFKEKVTQLKVQCLDNLQPNVREKLKANVEKELQNTALPNEDKVVLNTMLKLL